MRYDPNTPPVASEWLALTEVEQIAACEQFHRSVRPKIPRPKAHAVLHAVIETQLAEEIPSVVSALTRLQAEGLGRHESIHAIATVLIERISDAQLADPTFDDPNTWYYKTLDELTVDGWHERFDSPADAD